MVSRIVDAAWMRSPVSVWAGAKRRRRAQVCTAALRPGKVVAASVCTDLGEAVPSALTCKTTVTRAGVSAAALARTPWQVEADERRRGREAGAGRATLAVRTSRESCAWVPASCEPTSLPTAGLPSVPAPAISAFTFPSLEPSCAASEAVRRSEGDSAGSSATRLDEASERADVGRTAVLGAASCVGTSLSEAGRSRDGDAVSAAAGASEFGSPVGSSTANSTGEDGSDARSRSLPEPHMAKPRTAACRAAAVGPRISHLDPSSDSLSEPAIPLTLADHHFRKVS